MTQRTRDAESGEVILAIDGSHGAFEADDSVEFEQRYRRCRVVEIDLPRFNGRCYVGRDCIGIDLETHRESCRRADGSLNYFVHASGICPELFVAERVEAKNTLAGSESRW